MADTLTEKERSKRMSLIRSSNTKPERVIRRALHKRGLRFTLGNKQLPGKPDLVFPKYKVALFVHGCFWHRHANCKVASTPKSNIEFWQAKFVGNVERDERVKNALEAAGWRVRIVWECQLTPNAIEGEADRIMNFIRSGKLTEP